MRALLTALCALVLALAQPHTAGAGPDRVSILLGSHHGGATGLEGRNPGLFLTWEGDPLDVSAGVYRNSFGKVSVAVLGAVPVIRGRTEVSLFAGLAHYPGNGRNFRIHAGDLVLIGGLQLRRDPVFLQIMPGAGGAPVTIAFGLTFRN